VALNAWTCRLAFVAVLGVASPSSLAGQRAPSGTQRQAILDAVRPVAAARTRQSVRIVVARLNQVGDWAVLEGELVDGRGRALDWARPRSVSRNSTNICGPLLSACNADGGCGNSRYAHLNHHTGIHRSSRNQRCV